MILALPLFVLGVLANHAHHALAAHDLAVLTNSPHAGPNFHVAIALPFPAL
jgi:hypothetical protein